MVDGRKLDEGNFRLWVVEFLVNQIARGAEVFVEPLLKPGTDGAPPKVGDGVQRVIIHCLPGRGELHPQLLSG